MNRYVHTIFCDDIRQEVSNKTSYIGVYSDRMLVSEFPIILPKLCLALVAVTPIDQPFRRVSIRVLKGDETLAVGDIAETELAKLAEAASDTSEEDRANRRLMVRAHLVFSPLKLDDPCLLRVRVDTEEGELRGQGLRIEQAPLQAEQPSEA